LKKYIKRIPKKQLKLTCQTSDPGPKIEITPLKANKKEILILIFNQSNVKECDSKKKHKK